MSRTGTIWKVCFVQLCRACLSPTDPRTMTVNLDCSEASTSLASGKSPEVQKRRLPTKYEGYD